MFLLQLFAIIWTFARGDFTQLQNAALHKKATQSSLYTNDIPHPADLAVDGNSDPHFNSNGPCACTNHEEVTWWQVDMGDLFDIVQVKITNRFTYGLRLHDFDIQVSNTSSMTPNHLCFHYTGTVPDGVTETISCDTVIGGRFLRITKVSDLTIAHGDHLQLCEVEVLVLDRKNRKFFRHSGIKTVSSRPLLPVAHRVLCGESCLKDSTCVGFNYQEGTNICQLLYSTEGPVSDTEWWMYSLNLM